MKRNYIFVGLLLALSIIGSLVLVKAQTSTVVGSLQMTPATAKNGESFSIKLIGADSIPANTVTRLFIDTNEGGGFTGSKDFGAWLTVGELRAGITRTLNCPAYSSYDPSGPKDITGKTLSQKLYVQYGGLGSGSEVVTHTKDCSAPVISGGACSV